MYRAGDVAKAIVLVLCGSFLSAIALHETGHLDVFAPTYQIEGFCISNRDGSRWAQSHAISWYADSAMAVGMALLVMAGDRRGMSEESLVPIRKNAVSLFGHGQGHLFLALQTTHDSGASRAFEDLDALQRIVVFCVLFFVWFGFMRDRRRSLATTLAFAAGHNALQCFLLPTRFFFTHVLMAVLLGSAIRKLSLPAHEKDIYYDLEAWLVDVPIMLMSFGEALSCDSFLARFGGHVWFDAVVPIGFTAYYVLLVSTGRGLRGQGRDSVIRKRSDKDLLGGSPLCLVEKQTSARWGGPLTGCLCR